MKKREKDKKLYYDEFCNVVVVFLCVKIKVLFFLKVLEDRYK